MRLIVSGGGTGGHVYPALAVLAALREPPFGLDPNDVLYLGTKGRADERLVPQAGYSFLPIASGAVLGRGAFALVASTARILQGVLQSRHVIRSFQPHAVLATGGYVSVPVVVAAWLERLPSLVYLPDAEPGLAVRALARLSTAVAVTVPPRHARFPAHKLAVTGYPVRPGLGTVLRDAAAQHFGLDPVARTLLVWGGSQGARAVNRQIAGQLTELLTLCQVIHVTGPDDYHILQRASKSLSDAQRRRYVLRDYLSEGVPQALAAADLAVSRSGASVLGELTAARLPSILVPYPYAGAHQVLNARYLVDHGAAGLLSEDRIADLVPTIRRLITDGTRLVQMSRAAGALARPNAARDIARLLWQLGGGAGRAPAVREGATP